MNGARACSSYAPLFSPYTPVPYQTVEDDSTRKTWNPRHTVQAFFMCHFVFFVANLLDTNFTSCLKSPTRVREDLFASS